jgi:hypothetical protein|tara:strand:+ start:3430 stop:4494 length:1065 start_codon:yes stop_codon:yes gene_type:complete
MKKTEKTQKNNTVEKEKVNYECKICNYNTSNKTDYFRHLKRKKHLKNVLKSKKSLKMETEKTNFFQNEKKRQKIGLDFCVCSRKFKTRSGMWKHKKNCDYWFAYTHQDVSKKCFQKTPNVSKVSAPSCDDSQNSVEDELKHLQLQKAKLEVAKLKKEIENLDNPQTSTNSLTNELVETIGKIAGNNNCNNTNNISINMYLNENCKNAMNLEDFVRNISVSLQDLDYSKQNGYAKGITNIFMKKLADLEPTKRPIHCSDTKRLQFYVKDANKWEKDKNNIKLTSSIKSVGMEQVKKMSEWEKDHPNYMSNPKELKVWQTMLESVSGGINQGEINKNEHKIKKELGKAVDIKEELY